MKKRFCAGVTAIGCHARNLHPVQRMEDWQDAHPVAAERIEKTLRGMLIGLTTLLALVVVVLMTAVIVYIRNGGIPMMSDVPWIGAPLACLFLAIWTLRSW